MKENQIKGVMTELLESKGRKSAFEVFLSTEDIPLTSINDKTPIGASRSTINSILVNAKQKYSRILRNKEYDQLFKEMAEIETTIIQARCAIATETKLTMVNQKRGGSETSYIVARASFYNPENVKAEIRVYLGKTEELGNDLIKLSNDRRFMANAEKLIVNAMVEVMERRGVFASVKKSVSNKVLVANDGAEQNEDLTEVAPAMRDQHKAQSTPFNPSKKINPKPKSLGLLSNNKGKI